MFFDGWSDLLRILVVGSLAYAGLVGFLRVSGKRTLAKMNAFDLVVTVALGSTLATVLLNNDVSLAEGLFAFALLCALQYVVAFLAVRSAAFRKAIKSEPALLFRNGEYLRVAMTRERVSEDEIRAAIRAAGQPDPSRVAEVVLETDGSFSVVGGAETQSAVEGGPS
ncbi:MAG: DUF421 domain-containing protein [Rhodospirillales bacterium]|nr:DUF421 domain-containing protein [Rhodospirillales bacterium]